MGDSSFFVWCVQSLPCQREVPPKAAEGFRRALRGCLPGQAGRASPACFAATSPPCGEACFGRLRRPRKAPLTGELAEPARPEGLLSGLASAPVTLFYACYTAQQPHRRKLPAVPTAGRGLRRRQWRESRWPPVRRGQWLRRVLLPRQYMHNKENAVTMRLSAH